MNFLLVCGGTAGHINPALAIAAELRRMVPHSKILFVGAGRELEKRLIPQAGYHLVNISMSGLRRNISIDSILYNIHTAQHLTAAGVKARELLRRFGPDAVIGTGGYICYPVLKKAAKMGIPTLIHESNAVPGLTTKLLSASVDKVLISFPGLEKRYRRPERVILTGTPIRGGFYTKQENEYARGSISDIGASNSENTRPLVVSFMGSLGAEHINEIMVEMIKINAGTRLFDHIHAAGKNGGAAAMKSRLKQLGVSDELPAGTEIREYIDDMQTVMEKADLVICRAGGSTIAEVTVSGKPAILIPSPYVTNDQQLENAKQAQKGGGAILLQEKDCTGEMLFGLVSSLLADRDKLNAMSAAQRSLGAPGAASMIAGLVLELCASAALCSGASR